MNKALLLIFLAFSTIAFSQAKESKSTEEAPFTIQNEKKGVTDLGMYFGNLAQVGLYKNVSLNFGPSYNETSPLNFYELPILLELTHKKWQFYGGGQVNWMLDQDSLAVGNRFGSETFGLSVPVGLRYNLDNQTFMEFKYTRNVSPNTIAPSFLSTPQIKSEFNFGAGYKF